MPQCYLLAPAVGSSLDQQTNNVSLFTLVEQVNIPPEAPPPPGAKVPLEIHAYFRVEAWELGQTLEIRFVLRGPGGLETFSDLVTHRVTAGRFRTRTLGLDAPPSLGHYDLCVETRIASTTEWRRDSLSWPISFLEVSRTPAVTH
jgi:hypothetical protein